jgi:hypothetical protein
LREQSDHLNFAAASRQSQCVQPVFRPAELSEDVAMRKDTRKEESGQLDRRRVLTGAGLALGVAGATFAGAADGAAAAHDKKKPRHVGYRETKDVLTYYKLARF